VRPFAKPIGKPTDFENGTLFLQPDDCPVKTFSPSSLLRRRILLTAAIAVLTPVCCVPVAKRTEP
jgi:hypothetical protein